MDNGASSYRRFLDGEESALDEIMQGLFHNLVFVLDQDGNGILYFISGNLLSYEGNTVELNHSCLQQMIDLLQPETS